MSTLSLFDIACIQANFYYAVDEMFRCEEKIRDYAKRSNYEHAKQLVEKANGCNQIFDEVKYEIDNIGYHSCFCGFRHPYFDVFLLLFKNYEKGVMPFPGSLMDQPAYVISVLQLLEHLKAEREAEIRKREEAKSKK